MSFAGDVLAVTATVVVWSFGKMILFPSAANYMADLAPSTGRGVYMGMFQMTFSLAFALSVGSVPRCAAPHFGEQRFWPGVSRC